jgi:hypothetical protein
VGKVHVIIATQTTKVSNDAFPSFNLVVMKCPTFPLGKREGYLQMYPGEITWFEGSWAFDAVEIIVEAGGTSDEEGGRDTNEIEVFLEVVFEGGFGEEECFF